MDVVGVVLAAGFGTRLRPSTQFCPKPVIPVGGVEPLFFALYKLYELGIRKAIVNAHHLSEKIEQALEQWKPLLPGMELRLSIEKPQILGTGGSLLKIFKEHKDFISSCGILLQNGDTLACMDLAKLLKDPKKQSTFAISFLPLHLQKYKPLWIDAHFDWSGIGSQPPHPKDQAAHFLGVHYLCAQDVKWLGEQNFEVNEIDLFNGIYRPLSDHKKNPRAIEYFKDKSNGDFWFDMTNTEFLLEAQRYVMDLLCQSSEHVWTRCLKTRFPKIKEESQGIWVQARHKPEHTFTKPVVFVEGHDTVKALQARGLSLGPHCSWIHESGRVELGEKKEILTARNAVILGGLETQSEPLPELIEGSVYIL